MLGSTGKSSRRIGTKICVLFVCLCALIAGRAERVEAHPAPFSFVDITVRQQQVDVAVIVHIWDVAHEYALEDPSVLLDAGTVRRVVTGLGAVINVSLVKELGPVLAATMLAGRVGSAMAAELGTMRVTEQIDAIRALGANPVGQLVVPRFLACFLLIPVLTIVADTVGIVGGWLFSTQALDVNSHFYWAHSRAFVTAFDVATGLIKSVFFGGAIALVACYHGFHCRAGAKGVGRAATVSFVVSFVAILALDFFLGLLLNTSYRLAYPQLPSLL